MTCGLDNLTDMTKLPLLDQIHEPQDMRRLERSQLQQVADELRRETIDAVSVTGGHLGAGLGVVELTVALHYVFRTPADRLIWDVGHQAYPHKILTGRRDRIRTLRQPGGLSGFTRRSESAFDPFGAAHSSTSISAGLGMAVAAELDEVERNVVCVIGDGAMSAGMAYEAMNNAGTMKARLVVVLNDNDMSIARPVGAMSNYLSRVIASQQYRSFRHVAKQLASTFPKPLQKAARRAEEYARGMAAGGTLFEELGFYYIGPLDGHNLDHLLPVLESVRDDPERGPVLIHVVTQKGKGYPPAEAAEDKYHGVNKFNVATGAQLAGKSNAPSYTSVFAKALVKEAEIDDRIVAINAAMPSGTGLNLFAEAFPERCFDVGIAEQHAVTFCAGMACEGLKPVAAIYSTFLQRGFDQVIHDVCLQELDVTFAMDRAGIVGADGPTHHGLLDIAYLRGYPNIVLMAPKDEAEMRDMMLTAIDHPGPAAIRYPRGNGTGVDISGAPQKIALGKGEILRKGSDVAIIAYGSMVQPAIDAAEKLAADGIKPTVVNARFVKPLDEELILSIANENKILVTVEEAYLAGGFGSAVMELLESRGLQDKLKVVRMGVPDEIVPHGDPKKLLAQYGLDADGIAARAIAEISKTEGHSSENKRLRVVG